MEVYKKFCQTAVLLMQVTDCFVYNPIICLTDVPNREVILRFCINFNIYIQK